MPNRLRLPKDVPTPANVWALSFDLLGMVIKVSAPPRVQAMRRVPQAIASPAPAPAPTVPVVCRPLHRLRQTSMVVAPSSFVPRAPIVEKCCNRWFQYPWIESARISRRNSAAAPACGEPVATHAECATRVPVHLFAARIFRTPPCLATDGANSGGQDAIRLP